MWYNLVNVAVFSKSKFKINSVIIKITGVRGGGGGNGRHRYASEIHFFFHFGKKVQNAVISQIDN